jgi:hypothetical protein
MGTLQIRQTADKRILNSFDWVGFDRVIGPTSATVLWRQGSDAFALTLYMTRGFTGSQVYVKNGKKWFELGLPQFPTRFGEKQHLTGRGKGQFIVKQWLPNDTLKCKYEEGLVWDGKGIAPTIGDVEEDDWVFFRLINRNGTSGLKFIRLEPNREYGYDL